MQKDMFTGKVFQYDIFQEDISNKDLSLGVQAQLHWGSQKVTHYGQVAFSPSLPRTQQHSGSMKMINSGEVRRVYPS